MSKNNLLFNLYYQNLSKNLNLIDEELKNRKIFVCPLCNLVFFESDILEKKITIEHVIPDKLGGKIKTITCKKCNNDLGSKYIEKLINYFKIQLKNDNQEQIDYDLFVDRKLIKLCSNMNSDKYQLHQNGYPVNNNYLIEKMLKGKKIKGQLKIGKNFKRQPDEELIAILLCAYLLLFRYFGYSYAYGHWGREIRNVIMEHKTDSNLLNFIEIVDNNKFDDDGELIICKTEDGFHRFTVIKLRFKYKEKILTYQITLPFLNENKKDENFWVSEIESNNTFDNYQLINLEKGDFHLKNISFYSSINILSQENNLFMYDCEGMNESTYGFL